MDGARYSSVAILVMCTSISISGAPTSKNPPGNHGIRHFLLFIHQARFVYCIVVLQFNPDWFLPSLLSRLYLIWRDTIVSDRIYLTILHLPLRGIPNSVRGSSEQEGLHVTAISTPISVNMVQSAGF